MSKLSIVVPVYFNADNLRPLYADLKEKVLDKAPFEWELVLVDDGSLDESWAVIQTLCKEDNRVRGLHLSRNFGSHAAILCGLVHSTGDCAVVKAADLQEPSELILTMYTRWAEGNDVVLAARADREESAGQTMFSNAYYSMVRRFALPGMPKGGFDVFLLDHKAIDVLAKMDERNSAITGQILWSGFKTDTVWYTRRAREIGKSRWTLKKKIRLVADTLFSFSTVPITFVTTIGALSAFGSFIWAVVVLIQRLAGNIPVQGYTMLMITQVFGFGVIMLTLGILGAYLWRTFDASRNRPVYIVDQDTRHSASLRQVLEFTDTE